MKDKLRRFMSGRYGGDQFSRFTSICAIIALCVNIFIPNRVLYIAAWLLLIYTYYRFLSRDYNKRYHENMKFLEYRNKFTRLFKTRPQFPDREHRIFRCPYCHQKVRVPRGRGRISITCPKCRKEFVKKT